MFARASKFVRRRPLVSAVAATAVAVPLLGVGLVVHGTFVGKIYASSPATFLLKEYDAIVESGTLQALRAEAARLIEEGSAVRYNFPPGKAGAAVSYGVIQRLSPVLCDFYKDFASRVGEKLQLPLVPTPTSDNSSLSLLVYSAKGDHIDWHYDLNFYRGRHFTVLVPLIIHGPVDAQLQVALPAGAARHWRAPPSPPAPVVHASASQETAEAILGPAAASRSGNAFPSAAIEAVPSRVGAVVVFEGARVFHRVTPLGGSAEPWAGSWQPPPPPPNGVQLQPGVSALVQAGQGVGEAPEGSAPLRVVLSMTFTTDPRAGWLSTFQRRLKDMTYFGLLNALFG